MAQIAYFKSIYGNDEQIMRLVIGSRCKASCHAISILISQAATADRD